MKLNSEIPLGILDQKYILLKYLGYGASSLFIKSKIIFQIKYMLQKYLIKTHIQLKMK